MNAYMMCVTLFRKKHGMGVTLEPHQFFAEVPLAIEQYLLTRDAYDAIRAIERIINVGISMNVDIRDSFYKGAPLRIENDVPDIIKNKGRFYGKFADQMAALGSAVRDITKRSSCKDGACQVENTLILLKLARATTSLEFPYHFADSMLDLANYIDLSNERINKKSMKGLRDEDN